MPRKIEIVNSDLEFHWEPLGEKVPRVVLDLMKKHHIKVEKSPIDPEEDLPSGFFNWAITIRGTREVFLGETLCSIFSFLYFYDKGVTHGRENILE